MNKLELFLILFLLFLSGILFFLVNLSMIIFIVIGLIIIVTLILFYLHFRKRRIKSSLLDQARNILEKGNINRRIFLKNQGQYAELAVVFNELVEKLQDEIVKNKVANESRKQLLSNISHDIRTPLTSILGYVEALKDEENLEQGEKDKYLDILVNKAKNLNYIINEIFEMARLDADNFELDCKVHDLAEVVRESLIDFLPVIKREDFETKIDLPDVDCLIYADRLSVRRIIDNILKNSIKYGKDGKFIGIELNTTIEGFVLNIWDKGAGIREEDIPYVFDRLYMGDKSRNRPLSGSGLGLAIAKKLLEDHGGEICLESKAGEKTIFKLYFPGI